MFDQERAISEIASGKTLREVGAIVGCSDSYLCKVAATDPHFGEQYTRAMAIRAENDVEELRVIKRDVLSGKLTPEQGRVAADLIKWPASKRMPKVFGDRIQQDVDMRIQVELIDATAQARIVSAPAPQLPHKPQEDPL